MDGLIGWLFDEWIDGWMDEWMNDLTDWLLGGRLDDYLIHQLIKLDQLLTDGWLDWLHWLMCREKLERRNKSVKMRVLGIFPDATVVRGKDWDWKNQDGQ